MWVDESAHVMHRSLEDFTSKSLRGSGMKLHKPISFFHRIDEVATENCTAAVGFGPYADS